MIRMGLGEKTVSNVTPLYVPCASKVEISANRLTMHIKLKHFRSAFQFCWYKTIL